jgi:hypothetical protein
LAGKWEKIGAELRVDTSKLPRDMRDGTRKMVRGMKEAQKQTRTRLGAGMAARAEGTTARARGARGARMMGMGGGLRTMATGALAFGGFYGLQAELRKTKMFEETLVDLAVRGKRSKEWLDKLRGSVIKVSNEYGMGKEKLAAYVHGIIDKTGNTKLAVGTMKTLAAVAYSTNADIGALAGTVFQLAQQLKLAPKDFELAFGVLAAQADKGAVPLDQMQRVLPKILANTEKFGHTGVKALRDYGAMLQMAARGTASIDEAATSLDAAMGQIYANKNRIEKALGIKLTVKGQWKDLSEIFKLIAKQMVEMGKGGGKIKMFSRRGKYLGKQDIGQFMKTNLGREAIRAMIPMMAQMRVGAGKSAGGGLTSFEDLIKAGDVGTIGRRVKRKRELAPHLDKWNKAVNKFKNQIYQHMLPALAKLGDIMPTLGKWLKFLVDNFHLLLAIWASNKMRVFFTNMISMGQGMGRGGGMGMGAGAGRGLGVPGAMDPAAGARVRRRGRRGPAAPAPRAPRAGVGAAGVMGGISTAIEGVATGMALGKIGMDLIYGTEEEQQKKWAAKAGGAAWEKRKALGSRVIQARKQRQEAKTGAFSGLQTQTKIMKAAYAAAPTAEVKVEMLRAMAPVLKEAMATMMQIKGKGPITAAVTPAQMSYLFSEVTEYRNVMKEFIADLQSIDIARALVSSAEIAMKHIVTNSRSKRP